MTRTHLPLVLTLFLALNACGAGGSPPPPGGSGGSGGSGSPPPSGNPCPVPALAAARLLHSQGEGTLDPALGGVWKDTTGKLELVFQADGTAFVVNTMSGSQVAAEPGTWQIVDHKLTFSWLVSGSEQDSYGVTGEDMTLAGWTSMHRTGTSGEAPAEVARWAAATNADAQTWQQRYPVGPAQPGNAAGDPQPARRNGAATVYTQSGLRMMDLTLLDRYYTDEYDQQHWYKTFQSTEIMLYPSGRFMHTTVLPKGVDATHQPLYDMVRVWGCYSVRPGSALTGDTVTLGFDAGRTETAQVLDGRRYLRSGKVLYLNQDPKPRPEQDGPPGGVP